MDLDTLYAELELPTGATAREVRRAYRRLAFRHHPDRNLGDGEALRRFIRVSRSHEILSERLRIAPGGRFGSCTRCGRDGLLRSATDGGRWCEPCLLQPGRRFLPLPLVRLVRFYGVMALCCASAVFLARGALTGKLTEHATALTCNLAAMVWLAFWTIRICDTQRETPPAVRRSRRAAAG